MTTKKTKVEVYGETSKYERSMRNIKRTSRSTSQTISGHWNKTFGTLTKLSAMFGIAGAGGFVLLGKNAIDAGDLIHKLNLRLGLSTESLSQLQHAANLSGVEFNAVAKSFQKMQENISDAGRGIGEAKDALEQLGLDARQLQLLSPERQLEHIADALLGVATHSDKVRIAADIFGSRGVQMLQLMSDGSAGIKRMGEEFNKFGRTLTQVEAQAMADANDAMTTMKTSVMGVTTEMTIQLAPAIGDVAKQMAAWVAQNKELIGQGTHEAIDKIKVSVEGLKGVYDALPDGVVGAAGLGIIGRIISGSTPIGVMTGALVLLNEQLKATGLNITSLPSKFKSLSETQMNLWNALIGKRDWRTGADLTTGKIKDSWMGRPLSNAMTPESPDVSALLGSNTQDLWKNFGLSEKGITGAWQPGAYGFNEPQQQLDHFMAIEGVTSEHFRRMKEMTVGNKEEIAAVLRGNASRELAIEQDLQKRRLEIYQSVAGGIANTFLEISQAGGKQSKEAFKVYQAFAMVEAGISASRAILQALGSPPGPPWSFAIAGITGAMAAVQIGLIAAAKPPSYDQGGISTRPGMYYAGIPEAHVPLKGGAIPVNLSGGSGGGDTFININMDNPVFQDLETQQAVFAQIAEQIAPNAVVRAYDNDHTIRGRIRSRA